MFQQPTSEWIGICKNITPKLRTRIIPGSSMEVNKINRRLACSNLRIKRFIIRLEREII